MIKFEITQYHFAVPLTKTQWKILTTKDDSGGELHYESSKVLNDYGVEDVEWSGHFGMFFFFRCDASRATEAKAAVRRFLNAIGII